MTSSAVSAERELNQKTAPGTPSVVIVKSKLEQFRVPFFSGLFERLARENVRLSVAVPIDCCGHHSAPWLVPVRSLDIRLPGRQLMWQSVGDLVAEADLVIAQQSARELTNYWLVARRDKLHYKFALWGHGREFQQKWTSPITESIKRRVFRNVDFWFAYTPGVAHIVESMGYPADRVCSVFNSSDTSREISDHRAVTAQDVSDLRERFGMSPEARLIAYCGALYKAKRVPLLIDSCRKLRQAGKDVHLVVIGDGEEKTRLESYAGKEPWVHFVGSALGNEKARLLAAADCMAIPGVVGLAIVDAFAHECPLVTIDAEGHGPEIEYLQNGINGISVSDDIDRYTQALASLVSDRSLLERLRRGCRESAQHVTIENMIEHFSQGVLRALAIAPKR